MDIKDRLKILRKSKNLTQAELGENTQISLTTINKVEAGKGDLSTEQVIKLSKFFGVSTDYLLTGNEEPIGISEEEREILEFVRKDIDFKKAVTQAASLKKKAINYLGNYKPINQHATVN